MTPPGDALKDRGLRDRMSEAGRNELARRAGAARMSGSRYLLDVALKAGATVSERRMWAVEMQRTEARVQRVDSLHSRFLDEIGSATASRAPEGTVREPFTEAAEAVVAMGRAASDPALMNGRTPKPQR